MRPHATPQDDSVDPSHEEVRRGFIKFFVVTIFCLSIPNDEVARTTVGRSATINQHVFGGC